MKKLIEINLPDKRLNQRYCGLVKGHLQQATTTATGIAVPASVEKPFAITQATWRFLDNDRVTPLGLVEPLRHFARQQLAGADYTLAVNGKHNAKNNATNEQYNTSNNILLQVRFCYSGNDNNYDEKNYEFHCLIALCKRSTILRELILFVSASPSINECSYTHFDSINGFCP